MKRLFIIFLIIIQSFILSAKTEQIDCSAQKLNTHINCIITSAASQKKIHIDFNNYENEIIAVSSKHSEIFTQRNSNNIDGYFIGYLNSDFDNHLQNSKISNNHVKPKIHNISTYLKNEIHTRAP